MKPSIAEPADHETTVSMQYNAPSVILPCRDSIREESKKDNFFYVLLGQERFAIENKSLFWANKNRSYRT